MGRLTSTDAEKLAKILRLLSSSQTCEAAAAAVPATRFVRDRGLEWLELLQPKTPAPRPTPAPTPSGWDTPWRTGRHEQAAARRRNPSDISKWEVGFLDNIIAQQKPSPKQSNVLDWTSNRLRAAGLTI